jgi:hypothetical protein
VRPRADGGTNDASNLLTCCDECNEARGGSSPEAFAYELAAGGVDASEASADELDARVIETLERVIDALTAPLPDEPTSPA